MSSDTSRFIDNDEVGIFINDSKVGDIGGFNS
jgi:hypothetical protein